MKNPVTTTFEWVMHVTEKRYDAARGWEYQVKEPDGIGYGNGSWIAEKDLKDA